MFNRIFKPERERYNSYDRFISELTTCLEHCVWEYDIHTLVDIGAALDVVEDRNLPELVALCNEYAKHDEDGDNTHYLSFFRFMRMHKDLYAIFSGSWQNIDKILIDFYHQDSKASAKMRDVIFDCLEEACSITIADRYPDFDLPSHLGLT